MQRFRRHVNQSNVRTLFGSESNKQTSLFYFSTVSFVFPQPPLPNEPSVPNPTSQGLLWEIQTRTPIIKRLVKEYKKECIKIYMYN